MDKLNLVDLLSPEQQTALAKVRAALVGVQAEQEPEHPRESSSATDAQPEA
jgi:hypothetical protein